MNKKEAIAYAQVTLNFMQSSKYNGNISPKTFAIEMKQCFKLYPRNIIVGIAEAQCFAKDYSQNIKNGSDTNE